MNEKPEDKAAEPQDPGDATDETLDATPLPNRKIGKYQIRRKLGQGAMGEVWLAHNPDLDIPVAIKTLPNYLIEREPGFVKRFFKEAKTAARINHSNAVHVYDCGLDDDVHYIVMEYVDGGTVRELQETQGNPLPLTQAISIISAVAEALVEAARFNIIHRDIKPENIMLDSRGIPKLADLGLAKQIDALDDTGMTGTGVAIGTPKYIAPEQVQDAKSVDARADIYSLGVTFYHLVTGDVPFSASSSFEMMLKHVEEPLPHPKERRPDLADDVCAVICKMTEKSPAKRYQNAAELLRDLRVLEQVHAPETGNLTVAGESPATSSPTPKIIAAVAAVVLLVAGIGVSARVLSREKTATPGITGNAEPTDPISPAPVGGEDYTTPVVDYKLIALDAGSFKMGSADGRDHEQPVHTVVLTKPFWMGKFEVTQDQYRAFVEAADYRTYAERSESTMVYEVVDGKPKWSRQADVSWRNAYEGGDRAVVCINWHDAMAFCKWLNETERAAGRTPQGYEYRLPTEAEWEYACRAGTQTAYSCGDFTEDLDAYAWTDNNTHDKVHRVGDAKPNPWGLHDMHGNAAEWCLDSAIANYSKVITNTYREGVEDPLCLIGDARTYRGGSWVSRYDDCRSADRAAVDPDHHAVVFGFRLVLGPVMSDRTAKKDTMPRFGRPITVPDLAIGLAPIKAGYFKMGSDNGEPDEKPVHHTTISKPFWIGTHEITHGQFKQFADRATYRAASERSEATTVYDSRPGWRRLRWQQDVTWRTVYEGDKRAVVCVSWGDAMAFCKWLTLIERGAGRVPQRYEYRLPTEAEWEYCGRADSRSPYFWGADEEDVNSYAWTGWNTRDRIRVVGDKKSNRWGLYDMAGNAGEWCLDAADYQDGIIITNTYRDKVTDPLNRSGEFRIIRGGSWIDTAKECRSAARDVAKVTFHGAGTGFRIVLAPLMSNRVPQE